LGPDGQVVPHVSQYTELASGLHYKNQAGQWVETQEKIEVFPGGAVARQGPQQVIFANNLNSLGAIDMQTPDGKRLRSNVLGLMYYDRVSGNAVLIAQLQDSEGQLVADNQVLYTNAFEGVNVNLVYTYSKGGFEQDVILLERPQPPEAYGIDSENAEIEVLTEFIDPPEACVQDMGAEAIGAEPDETVSWGSVSLGGGKAFNLGAKDMPVGVTKRYVTVQGRHYLLEKVPVKAIESSLSKLPEQAANQTRWPVMASKNPQLPRAPKGQGGTNSMKLALASRTDKGYVLDYVSLVSPYTNYIFQGNNTYYVSGALNLYGTTTLSAGTVLKYTTNGTLNINGVINCQTGPYRPAVLTAKDDDSVGENISGSTGTPSGYYGTSFSLFNSTTPQQLHDLRISHAASVISVGIGALNNTMQNVQIYHVGYVISSYLAGSWNLQNILMARVGSAVVSASTATVNGEHWTVAQANTLNSGGTLSLTNSLLNAITNLGTFTSVNNATNNSSGIFQVVGGGGYYLATNSPYRNAGTTNIDPAILAQLGNKTTYPPIVYSNVTFTAAQNFTPQVHRDTDLPDLGYHYDPLDYVFGAVNINSNVTFAAGTAVGFFVMDSGPGYGLMINNGATVAFNGNVVSPCHYTRYNNVQEGGNGLWTLKGWLAGIAGTGSGNPTIAAQFTIFSSTAGAENYVRDYYGQTIVQANHCEFYSGVMTGYGMFLNLTNNLFEQITWLGDGTSGACGLAMRNCTMHGGGLYIQHWSGATWPLWVENCAFDGTDLTTYMNEYSGGNTNITYCDFNAFTTNITARLPVLGTHDVLVNNFNWQSSWLGNYYLPYVSPLIDTGSRTADQVGLYHFTTQTNQSKETNSIVDIGYHYVVTGSNGLPLDSDADGTPDYIDDRNGNGVVDGSETNWALAILSQPASQTVVNNAIVNFNVVAAGIQPIGYQWQFNGTNLAGAKYSILTLPSAQQNQAGIYNVIITNVYGAITSAPATLSVCAPTMDAISNQTVYVASGAHTLTLTGISGGCSPIQIIAISASSSNPNIVADPAVAYASNSSSGILTFIPSLTQTGLVTISVTLLDAQHTNTVKASLGFGGKGILDPATGWYNNLLMTNVASLIGNGAFGNIGTGTNLYCQNVIFAPPTFPVGSFMTFENAGTSVQFDAVGINAAPIIFGAFPNQWLVISLSAIAHVTGFQDTLGVIGISSSGELSPSVAYLSGSASFGSWGPTLTFQVNVIAPPMSVSILAPTNQTLLARTNVTITAMATNSAGGQPVNWVQFFAGTNSLGYSASTNGVYSMPWLPKAGGTYVLTALAYNTNGYSAWSAPVTNYVKDLPSISIISPTKGQFFGYSPTNILLQATVTTNWGTITGVAFKTGTNIWRPTNTGSLYTFMWTNVVAGTHTLSAFVTNNYGMIGIATNVTFTVEPTNRPPLVFVGTDQTNYLSTIAFPLTGLVSDDGLPIGSTLTTVWTNLSGGTNVTFTNANLPMTGAYFWATGAYTLQLSASDSQFAAKSNVTITVLPTNQSPQVILTTNRITVVLPALENTNPLMAISPIYITNGRVSGQGEGVAYFPASNSIIMSLGGMPAFQLISTNGVTPFSSLDTLPGEIYLTSVKSSLGGFKPGEVFCGNGVDGEIMRLEPDGSAIGTNVYTDASNNLQTNCWVVLTNSDGSSVGSLRGGLWVDETGIWGGDLIVSTEDDSTYTGYVWRINSFGIATKVATLNGGDYYEGITTIPNDPERYGPWAGRILVGNDFGGSLPIFAINTNGIVVTYYLGIGAEDIRVIPANENLYSMFQGADKLIPNGLPILYATPATQFAGMTGDILIVSEFSPGGGMFRVHWDGTNFNVSKICQFGPDNNWEQSNFAPAGIMGISSLGVPLPGVVIDDGELFATRNRWMVVSNASPVVFYDSTQTNTLAQFSVPGDYLLRLTADDGQFTSFSNLMVHVARNQRPYVFAGTNITTDAFTFTLEGVVTDDALPYGITNISWSAVGWGTGNVHFASSNLPVTSVSFDGPGSYVLQLAADDGQATNFSQVVVSVQGPSVTLIPSYGTSTSTNESYTVMAQVTSPNNGPVTGIDVSFAVSGNYTNQTVATDSNGMASFTYYSTMNQPQRDTITAGVTWTNGAGFNAVQGVKDWAADLRCGDIALGQNLGTGGLMSREWTNLQAQYYSFAGTTGDVVHLTLVQNASPLVMLVRDPGDNVVAMSTVTYTASGSISKLNFGIVSSGNYLIEVAGSSSTFDLYATCNNETNAPTPYLEVLYKGTNIVTGGTVNFPETAKGGSTNISLTVTNAGSVAFTVTNFLVYGNYSIPNAANVLGVTLAPGRGTNLTVVFNGSTNGGSWGSLAMEPDYYSNGSNFVVNFEAATFATVAPPAIQILSPADGSTWFDNKPIACIATVVPGSSALTSSNLVGLNTVDTNVPNILFSWLDYFSFNNYAKIVNLTADGDRTIVAFVQDPDGNPMAFSSPVLFHVIPYVSPTPTRSPQIGVLLDGTNIVNGSTVQFPQTIPGLATNIQLVITNSGTYPLGIDDIQTNGDFWLANALFNTVLMPGTSTNLTVIFNASIGGDSYGQLVLSNSVTVGGHFLLTLVGTAVTNGYFPPVTNSTPPVASNDTFHVSANSVNNLLYPLVNDIDTNYPLILLSITPPDGGTAAIINHGTAVRYTPPHGFRSAVVNGVACPADGFYYTVSDGHGGTARGTISIFIDASDIPEVTLTASNSNVAAGSIDPLSVSVAPAENVTKVDFYVDGTFFAEVTNAVAGVYTTNWVACYPGGGPTTAQITASATDRFGQVGIGNPVSVTVAPPVGGGMAVAALTSVVGSSGTVSLNPAGMNVVRDGLFQLYGSAYHSLGSNVTWQVGVYLPDGTFLTNLTQPNSGAVGSNTPANLVTCDLTTLMNGVYDLRLTVNGGYTSTNTDIQLQLDSNLKIGQFSFNQQDLVIPVSGIPLTVTRTYNSINPGKGDFGYGWTYALANMDVSLDETRADVEDLDGNLFSQRTRGGWDVTLNLPNGQRTTFAFFFATNDYSQGVLEAAWRPAPGVTAKLAAKGNVKFHTLLGSLTGKSYLYYWDVTGPRTPWEDFDFSGFVLTTADGTQYDIEREDLDDHFIDNGTDGCYVHAYGKPFLHQIIDRNTNNVTINPDAILFKAFTGATNQITFQRNTDGLIVSVSDPNGQSAGGPPAVKYEYDANANLINVLNLVDRTGAGVYVTNSFSYTNANFPHYITGIVNADGTQVASNFYDDSGKLVAVRDADGKLTQFIHNLTNDSEVIIDRLGYTNTYVYDLRGNVICQTNQAGQITTMAYDANNNKTNEVVYLNNLPYATNNYAYDTNNLLVSVIDPLGHTNGIIYDSFGNVLASADALGHSTVYGYDASGNLVTTTDALGHGTTNFYGGGLLLGSVDAVGTLSTNVYDPSTGYLVQTATLDAAGAILSSNTFTYDGDGNRLTSTVWRRVNSSWTGSTTTYIYDGMNRVVQTINPDGGTNTVVYDAIGKQQATIDPLGHTTSYSYDAQGRLIQTTYADLTSEKSRYDANGNRVQSIDRANRATTSRYDALNRVVETIYPDNSTNGTVYDGVGRVAQTMDARGTVTAFSYDSAGRRLAVTNAVGTSVQTIASYGYDANGNQITFTDGLGHTTTNVLDGLNRQVQTLYPDGTVSATGYDAVGRRVAETNQDGVVTRFGYDGAGRLISVTNALNQVTRYQYDETGNEVVQIDALNRTNTFAYDSMGRRIAHTRPDAKSEWLAYDVAGNLTSHTNFGGNIVIASQYDEMNRLTNTTDNASFHHAYTYTVTGQRQSQGDYVHGNTISYTYDNCDRLAQKTVVWNYGTGLTAALNYGYDANGNVTNLVSAFANGVHLSYGYDALNRLTNVLSRGQAAASYSYDSAGNLQALRYGNGVTNVYQYDPLNRLTNLVWQAGGLPRGSFAYRLQSGGTRTNLVETINATPTPVNQTYAWSFDQLYRLTNEVVSGAGMVGYGYDAVGNRTSRNSSIAALPTDAYLCDTNDQLVGDSSNSFHSDSYDVNGNTVYAADYANSYGYDGWNRLTNSTVPGRGTNNLITYDGDGNRLSKQYFLNGDWAVRYYLVDDRNPSGYPQVLEEYEQTSGAAPVVLNRVYNYGLGLVSQQQLDVNSQLPATISYYGFDGHGSVRFLLGTNGGITDTYTYDAYGTLIATNGNTPNNYLYAGQQFDCELGLYYNRARYLNTEVGRFWSADGDYWSNEDPLSLHKYLYCKGNPVNKVDPSGHDGIDDILTIADAIGTFGASVSSPSIGRVTGTGGPDVTKALNRTLLDVQAKFWSWNRAQKIAAAERMRDLWGAATSREANGARAGAADAWDIFPLMEVGFDINYGYLIANGQSYRAGTGFWTRTVAFSGKCYYASAVNYALWGTMNRCVSDWLDFDPQAGLDRDEYSLGVAVHIMQAFKHFSYHDFGPIEKEAADFTAYGFNGTPPSWALPCKPSGVVAAKMFDWCWEPVVPRNPGARR